MSEKQFDPYHVWLGIPPKDQPPNLYRLLGLELYEDDAQVIDAAANRQTSYLHEMASGPNRRQSQDLLNEIAAARRRLLDAERKKKYDENLRAELAGKDDAEQATDLSSVPAPVQLKSDTAAGSASDADRNGSGTASSTEDVPTDQNPVAAAETKKPGKSPAPVTNSGSLRKKESSGNAISLQAAIGGVCLLLLVIVAAWVLTGLGDEDEVKPSGQLAGTETGSTGSGGDTTGGEDTTTTRPGEEHSAGPAPESLLAHWTFNDADIDVASVSEPGSMAMTKTGEPTIETGGPFGRYIQLDGQNDTLQFPATALNIHEGTIAAWFRIDKSREETSTLLLRLRSTENQRLDLRRNQAGGLSVDLPAPESPLLAGHQAPLDEWFHVAVTWKKAGPVAVYLNGRKNGQSEKPHGMTSSNGVVAGSSPGKGGKPSFVKVALDDLRFYEAALDESQIAKLIAGSTVTPTELKPYQPVEVPKITVGPDGLVAHYSFEDVAKPEVDKSGNGTGTNHGAKVVADPIIGQTLDLDGSGKFVEVPRIVADDFTISFWLKTELTGPESGPWHTGAGLVGASAAENSAGFGAVLRQGRVVFFVSDPDQKATREAISTTSVSDGKWHFIALARHSGTGKMQLHVDGALEATADGPKGPRADSPAVTLGKVPPGTVFLKGQIASLRIHNQSLAPAKLMELGGNPLAGMLAEKHKAHVAAISAKVHELHTTETGKDQILSECWNQVPGDQLSQFKERLTASPTPDQVRYLNSLSATPKESLGEHYGQRVTGYLLPPKSGNYTFQATFDDVGEFWLSLDDRSENLKLLKGDPVVLRAEAAYFFQVLHMENTGDDQFSIKWTIPGGDNSSEIGAAHLSAAPQFRMFLPLRSPSATADSDATLTIGPDNSILASGGSRHATYTVDLEPSGTLFTGFRFDALPHESHPSGGPGMGAMGVFAVSEVEVFTVPVDSGAPVRIDLEEPVSSEGVPKSAADGDNETTWTVRRRSGEAGSVSLFLIPTTPVQLTAGLKLRFAIHQETNVGRFRILGTAMPSEPLRAIIAKAGEQVVKSPRKKLKLLVNLNGRTVTDPKTKDRWVASREFKGGTAWGHKGGMPIDNAADKSPLGSAIQGIQSFHAKVENGAYDVTLYFADHWANNPGERQFTVQIEKPSIGGNVDVIQLGGGKAKPWVMEKVVGVSDGSIDILFTKVKGEAILNAIRIEEK